MASGEWSGQLLIEYRLVETSLGRIIIAAHRRAVCYLSFKICKDALAACFARADIQMAHSGLDGLCDLVLAAIEDPAKIADVPVTMTGTDFQLSVWKQLQQIPLGETRSYADIAQAIGNPAATRAVGAANGANKIAVLIPCHRIIRSDGSLGGYAGGVKLKKALLDREKAMPQPAFL